MCLVKVLSPIRIGFLALMASAGLALVLFLWQPVWLFHDHEFRIGDEIVSRVEAFRASHGRLPETLKEVGMDDTDLKVFYRRISDDEYIVWFGTTQANRKVLTPVPRNGSEKSPMAAIFRRSPSLSVQLVKRDTKSGNLERGQWFTVEFTGGGLTFRLTVQCLFMLRQRVPHEAGKPGVDVRPGAIHLVYRARMKLS
jgi:hypothetical protein